VVESIDVNAAVEHSLLLVKHELESKAAHVETRYDYAGTIFIDRLELQQVMVNLLINAVRAIGSGGRVEVSTQAWGNDGVVVCVTDNGVGIAPHDLERIFDPFFTTQNTGGTGLGLSVSYGIVRRYGGDIEVESSQGHGASFRVRLPRQPATLSEAESAVSTVSEAIAIDERGNV
jgi:two-component system NtrC family sensor kinase